MDRRTQRTRRAICDAFSGLLSKKSYSRITIQEIIDAANVGRSTFYAHFSAKEDLLKELCTEMFQHIFCCTPAFSPDGPPVGDEEGLCLLLEHLLGHMAEKGRTIQGILSSEGSGYFILCFKGYMDEFTDRYILKGRQGSLGDMSPAFFKNHISGSFVEAVRWWFGQGCQPAPRVLARQYAALLLPILPGPAQDPERAEDTAGWAHSGAKSKNMVH